MSFRRVTADIIRGGGTCTVVEGGRSRSFASSSSSVPKFFPTLAPSYQATLGYEAHRDIRREIRSAAVEFDFREVETGGWLLSDERWPDRIVLATDAGEGASYSRSSVHLDLDRAEEMKRTYPHLSLRGDWHLHPTGDEIPSETDRRAWMRGCELTGDYWIAIVATPARSYLGDPDLHGWLTTKTFCEPLRLVEL
jgi:proteasome lid subunit RPN8/RPN11